jgi:WD40 repeat protein
MDIEWLRDRFSAVSITSTGLNHSRHDFLRTTGRDNTTRVWETVGYQEVARLPHDAMVRAVGFSPDGRYVATADGAGRARVWLWRTADRKAEACARLVRNLTPDEWAQYIGDEPYRATCQGLPTTDER